MEATASSVDRQAFAATKTPTVPELSRRELERRFFKIGIAGRTYRAFLALLCVLSREHGYAFPKQAWLAAELAVTVRTIGTHTSRARLEGHLRVVRTGRSSECYPHAESLGLLGTAEQIRKEIRSHPLITELKQDAVADATASPPSSPQPTREEVFTVRQQLRSLPDGDEAAGLLGRAWFQQEPALALEAARKVIQYDRDRQPVLSAPALLIRVYKGLRTVEEGKRIRAAELAAQKAIGEYQPRPTPKPSATRRVDPPPIVIDDRAARFLEGFEARQRALGRAVVGSSLE